MTPKLPPPPPLSAQNRSGSLQALTTRILPGRHDFGFEQAGRGHAVVLREAAEAAAADESCHADGHAAAALHVAARLRHRIVGAAPDLAGAEADRWLRRELTRAAARHERIERLDRVHVMCPHEQRIGRLRGAMVAVAAALHDEAQRMFAREIDRGGHVRGVPRGDCEIHEHASVDGEVRTLAGDLHHHAYRSLSDQIGRLERYACLMAAHMHARGRRAHVLNILFNPFWRFVRGLVLRAGFRDGWRGLVFAYVEANYVRQEFISLWLLQHGYGGPADEPPPWPKLD